MWSSTIPLHNDPQSGKPAARIVTSEPGDQMVTIVLEQSRTEWVLPKQLLRDRSEYFANAFKNNLCIQEAGRTSHTLYGAQEEAFCIFATWLTQSSSKRLDEWYQNQWIQVSDIDGTLKVKYTPIPDRIFPLGLVKFYILAYQLRLVPEIFVDIINGIIRYLSPSPSNHSTIDPMIRTSDFTFAQDNLSTDDPMRRLITDLACISFIDRRDRPTFTTSNEPTQPQILAQRGFFTTLHEFTRDSTTADGTQSYIDPLADFWHTPHQTVLEMPRYQIGCLGPESDDSP